MLVSLLSRSIAIRSAHDAARVSLAEAILQNNTGFYAEDGGLVQVTSADVHSSELMVVALATPLDNLEQVKAATADREEFERIWKRGSTTGEPEDSARAVVSQFHSNFFFSLSLKAQSLKHWTERNHPDCPFLRGFLLLAGPSFYVWCTRDRRRLLRR